MALTLDGKDILCDDLQPLHKLSSVQVDAWENFETRRKNIPLGEYMQFQLKCKEADTDWDYSNLKHFRQTLIEGGTVSFVCTTAGYDMGTLDVWVKEINTPWGFTDESKAQRLHLYTLLLQEAF